jgi:DNA (cytosine-5)-methyltransferase 1
VGNSPQVGSIRCGPNIWRYGGGDKLDVGSFVSASASGALAPPTSDGRVCVRYEAVGQTLVRSVISASGRRAISRLPASGIGKTYGAEDQFDLAWLRSKRWPHIQPNSGVIRVADLFCGSGGLTLGAWEACRALQRSLKVVFAADSDVDALTVFAANFAPAMTRTQPVEQFIDGQIGAKLTPAERSLLKSMEQVDLLLAGPPCQGHSDLNNFTRRNDPRNALILQVARFAELVGPRHVVIENVQGLAHDQGGYSHETTRALERLGYSVCKFLLDGSSIGLPQQRRRCFVVASKTTQFDETGLVERHRQPPRTFDWACGDLQLGEDGDLFNTSAKVYPDNQRRMQFLLDHNIHELPDSERPDCHRLKPHGYTSVYGRLYADRPAPTITTGFGSPGQGRFTHPRAARTLTPHEAARLQFFPDFFEFPIDKRKRLQKVIGNAVPPKLALPILLELLSPDA